MALTIGSTGTVLLFCDGDQPQGDPTPCRSLLHVPGTTRQHAWTVARTLGWRRRRWGGHLYDLCAHHAEKYRH